jgi:hypothetical protein
MPDWRGTAVNAEAHYPEYAAVVQDLQSKTSRYVSLLALAETAMDTEEYLRFSKQAEELRDADPRLQAVPGLDTWVSSLADLYRQEAGR